MITELPEFKNAKGAEVLKEGDMETVCSVTNTFCNVSAHPDLVELNPDILKQIQLLDPDLVVVSRENKELAVWSIALPVGTEAAGKFLERKITEREMFRQALEQTSFKSLYFIFVYAIEASRGSGAGVHLVANQVLRLKRKHPEVEKLFAAVIGDAAKRAIQALRTRYGLVFDYIEYRK